MRIGIDLGGTKIAAVALDSALDGPSAKEGAELARARTATPPGYAGTLSALAHVVAEVEQVAGRRAARVGLCLPGVVDAAAGRVRAVNLPWLDGHPLAADLARVLDRPVAMANDGDCFTLSEAVDGAAAGAAVVYGVILGTGVGGGLVVDGRIRAGANALAGEWGHLPLPWRTEADGPPLRCGCGRMGCIETVLSGPGMSALHAHHTGEDLEPPAIAARAASGDPAAALTLERHADALARALVMLVHVLDPDVIVAGGGLSGLAGLERAVTEGWGRYALAAPVRTRFVRARHGAESGMRGAARL